MVKVHPPKRLRRGGRVQLDRRGDLAWEVQRVADSRNHQANRFRGENRRVHGEHRNRGANANHRGYHRARAGDERKGEDVANSAVFLASDMSDYITGETIHVNGGMYMA